jgi:GNAT superfamily N-acetyltransferase
MIQIRRIQPDEWPVAKQLVYRVIHGTFSIPRPLDQFIAEEESQKGFKDLDDIQAYYFDCHGIFLITEADGQIIGTGAIRQLEEKVCELRRVFLLFEYQSQGLGYRMIMELLRMAREFRYEKIRLETAPVHLKRANALYRRIGFYEIPRYHSTHPNDIAMELAL